MIFAWYRYCFAHYFSFSGRASRAQYWSFTLVNMAVLIGFALLANYLEAPEMNADGEVIGDTVQHPLSALILGTIYFLYCLAIFFPTLSATVRRLHDRNHSGFWVLAQFIPVLNFVVFIFMILPSSPFPNNYGARAPRDPDDSVPRLEPNYYNLYSNVNIPQTPTSEENPREKSVMTQIKEHSKNIKEGSALDVLMKEDLPNADAQAGVEVVKDPEAKPTTGNSETHRPMGANESGLVSLLNKLSK